MADITNISRRGFVQGAGALVIGAHVAPTSLIPAAYSAVDKAQPNVFISIDKSGTVTLTSVRAEMGQGVRTGVPMMLADELEADWDRVKLWQAPGDPTQYDPAGQDKQNTDGSRSTRHHFDIMREIGAVGRTVLEQAAAQMWGTDVSDVYAKHHRIHRSSTGESFDYGELVDVAATIEVPTGEDAAKPKLKDASDWKYIGKDLPQFDNFDISTGGANYGADASIPGMKIAVVARAPVFRGKVKSFDATEALKIQGVEQVVEIPALADDVGAEFHALGGIAVIGTNTWSVMQGRKALEIEWDDGPFTAHDSSTYDDGLRASAKGGGKVIRDRGAVGDALAQSDKVLESEYFVPYFIHTPMEPPAAIVDATVRPVKIIASTQSPFETRQYVAKAIGVDIEETECWMTLLGGGFGRKSKPDFACEAAILSKMVDAPVRMQWTREDEVRNGYYHTASASCMKAGLDAGGKVTAFQQCVAFPSIIGLWNPAAKHGFNIEYGLGLVDLPYNDVPNIRIENAEADIMIRVGWYRSVNNIQHAFAQNCFAHELATAAGRDPVEVLAEMIGESERMDVEADGVEDFWNYGDSQDKWPIMPNRLSNALRTVAAKSGYGKDLPKGHGIGIAAHRCFHSYVATAVHVVVSDDGTLSVPQVDVAIDCGRYVNPEGVKKQIEGACIYGHSVATQGKITTTAGAVDQGNFNDYPVTRMNNAPLNVDVHLVEDFVHLPPCGVGEPGVPPYAPALMNAIFDATGKRIRTLPLGAQLREA